MNRTPADARTIRAEWKDARTAALLSDNPAAELARVNAEYNARLDAAR